MNRQNILLVLVISIVSCKEPLKEKNTKPEPERNDTERVKLADLDGQHIQLDQYKGKTIFLNFWATWCKPCIREIPSIKAAKDSLSKEGIVFLFASDEVPELIKEFKTDHNPDLNYVRVLNLEELNIQGLPTTYVYNPNGQLVFAETGYRKWDDSANIQMLLKINNQSK